MTNARYQGTNLKLRLVHPLTIMKTKQPTPFRLGASILTRTLAAATLCGALAVSHADTVNAADAYRNRIMRYAPEGTGAVFADTGLIAPTFIAIIPEPPRCALLGPERELRQKPVQLCNTLYSCRSQPRRRVN